MARRKFDKQFKNSTVKLIIETSAALNLNDISKAITRIAGKIKKDVVIVPQDKELADNQSTEIRCGDNGIFRGMPLTMEQLKLSKIARELYQEHPFDGTN